MTVAGFVLAAGLGTRISVLSVRVPKPLLPVGDTTPLAAAVARLWDAGARTIVANAAHLPEQVVAAGLRLGIEVVVERDGPLGTAGGLAHARGALGGGPVLIWNGDVVADLDPAPLVPAGPELARLAVRDVGAAGTGNVGLDADGRVVRLRKQSFGVETRGAHYAAVMGLSPDGVRGAPTRGCLVGDLLIPAIAAGADVRAVVTSGSWHDIGDLASYFAANLARPYVSPIARVTPGIDVRRVVLGDEALVGGYGLLDEVVAWPKARLMAPLRRAIVTPDQVLEV